MNIRLRKLAVLLKNKGLEEESAKVLSLLNRHSLLKSVASKKEESVESKKDEERRIGIEALNRIIEEGGTSRAQGGPLDLSDPEEGAKYKSSKKDLLLKVRSKDKGKVRRLQKALMKAGFDLPRFGVDGIFGKETKAAVIKFQEKATSDGKYSGKINGTIDNEGLELIESYADKALSRPKAGPGYKGDFVLYIGDSQMRLALGKALMSVGGSGKKFAKSSTKAAYWAEHTLLEKALRKGPSKIIISLNGNGIAGTGRLIKKIMKHNSNTPVIWTGAVPPIRREDSSFDYLNSDDSFKRAYDKRNRRNEEVEGMIPSHWTFINPYDHIKYSKPQLIGATRFESGYTCDSCDGIHLPSSVAEEYVSNIKGLLA